MYLVEGKRLHLPLQIRPLQFHLILNSKQFIASTEQSTVKSHTWKAVPLLWGIYVPAVSPYFLRAEHKLQLFK